MFAGSLTLGSTAHAQEAEHPDAQLPTPAKASKKKKRHAVLSGRLATTDELRDEPLDKPSGHIELYAVNFGETVAVDIYNDDGSYNQDALDQLNHFWRCKRTNTEKAIEPKLYEMLSRIYDHFGKRLELVSGFRNQKRTSSFHFHGSASDIRIAGVPDKVLHKFVTGLDTGGMGIGIYPRAGFIHVDIRPEPSYRWTDYSPPGSSDMGHAHKKSHKPANNT
jgi:uncharacterized protein YcbK (DUF882 family)